MFSNRLAFAVLGLACVTAAGAGSYLATRQTVTTATVAASPAAATINTPVPPTDTARTPETATAPQPMPTAAAAVSVVQKPAPVSDETFKGPSQRQVRDETPRQPRQPERRSVRTPRSSESVLPPPPPAFPSEPIAAALPAVEKPIEPAPLPEPARTFDELVVAADSVIGLQTETTLTSDRARVEDRVEARVVRDVRVGGEVAIPAGTRAVGTVVEVERGGKFKERARLGIRFNSLLLADGSRLPLTTDVIYRYGDAPGNSSAARIGGGAVAGAILGAILGGGKGAAIGATTGAGAGTATVIAGEASVARFPAGAEVTARILAPVTVTVERE